MKSNPQSNNSGFSALFGLSLFEYVAILFRRKWQVLSVFLIILGTVIGLTLLMKPTYEATVSIMIDTKQSPSALFQDVRLLGTTIDLMQNEMAVLNSRSLADDVAERLIGIKFVDSTSKAMLPIVLPIEGDTVNPLIAAPSTVVARLSQQMAFASERESYVITITASSVNPKEAALLANTYAEAYSDRNIFESRSKSRSFREFLGDQLTTKRLALEKKEDSLQTYMRRTGVVSLDEETKQLMSQMATLEAQRDANDIEIRSLLSTLAQYKTQIEQQEKSIARAIGEANDPYIRLLQEQLAQLEVQRDITVAQTPEAQGQSISGTRLKEIDAQINDLRSKLQKRTEQYVANILPASQGNGESDPTGYLKEIKQKFLETQITIQTLQAKRDALNQAIIPYERRFASVPAKSLELARLTRERTSLEQLYTLLEGKYNEANVTEQSEFGYIQIFDPAVPPLEPSSPNLFVNIALGFILGLGMGGGFAFFREFLEQKIHSPEDLVRRGFVALSTIAALDPKKDPNLRADGASGKKELAYRVAMNVSVSKFTESLRHLRTNLTTAGHTTIYKTVMISSPEPGEGKTTVACNLAIILARSGKKVLLVDADLREPAVHLAFGLDPKGGLAQILRSKSYDSTLVKTTEVAGLHVLCSGHSPANAAELLDSPDMKFLVSQFAEEYDYVIFDSAPVLAVSDPLILSKLVDGVILVVSAGQTASSALTKTADMLSHVGANVLGVVLNRFDIRRAYGLVSTSSGYGYYGYADKYGANGEKKKTKAGAPA
jgi:tyrosine-protein kinase Etk/Wzc